MNTFRAFTRFYHMKTILGVKFKDYGQMYYFSSGPYVVAKDEHVIVETDQGMGLGQVAQIFEERPKDLPGDVELEDLKPIFRVAGADDMEQVKENEALSRRAFAFCEERIREHKLDMKLVSVDVFFDQSKMVFFFTAPGRVDFRELVKDLVREYRTRIELRQIGVRHETQMLGAMGNCGMTCCCRRFMRKFDPVTIKMAKEQNLFLNPTKISGICGRLLCCLGFEQEHYSDFKKRCPRIGKKYTTGYGYVKVLRANIFNESLFILLENNEEREISLEEWNKISKLQPGDVPIPPKEPPRADQPVDDFFSDSDRPSFRGRGRRSDASDDERERGPRRGQDDSEESSRSSKDKSRGRKSRDGSSRDKSGRDKGQDGKAPRKRGRRRRKPADGSQGGEEGRSKRKSEGRSRKPRQNDRRGGRKNGPAESQAPEGASDKRVEGKSGSERTDRSDSSGRSGGIFGMSKDSSGKKPNRNGRRRPAPGKGQKPESQNGQTGQAGTAEQGTKSESGDDKGRSQEQAQPQTASRQPGQRTFPSRFLAQAEYGQG